MDSLTSVLKGVNELEKYQKGEADGAMFLTWPAYKFCKTSFYLSSIPPKVYLFQHLQPFTILEQPFTLLLK